MKRFIVILLLFILGITIGYRLPKTKHTMYDINQDGKVNALDLLILQKYIIENGGEY